MPIYEIFCHIHVLLDVCRLLTEFGFDTRSRILGHAISRCFDASLLFVFRKRLALEVLSGLSEVVIGGELLGVESLDQVALEAISGRKVLLVICLIHVWITICLPLLFHVLRFRQDVNLLWLYAAICHSAEIF